MGIHFHRKRGGGYPLSPETSGPGVSTFTVENCPESHKPVEISDLRAQGASKIWGSLEVQNGPPGPPGAILAPGKSYSTIRGGADDGGMAGVEGKRIKTPGAVA